MEVRCLVGWIRLVTDATFNFYLTSCVNVLTRWHYIYMDPVLQVRSASEFGWLLVPNNHPLLDVSNIASNSSKNGYFLTDFSKEGQNDNQHPKVDEIDHPIWMASIYIHNWMTLIIQIWMKQIRMQSVKLSKNG